MDPAIVAAQSFMDSVHAMTSWADDGPAPATVPVAGARAMARLVLAHPVVAEGRRPTVAVRLFPAGQDDQGLLDLRGDATAFAVGGALALGMTGAPLDDTLAGRLLIASIDVDLDSIRLRKEILRKPVGPPDPVFPGWLDDLQELVQRNCWAGVQKALIRLGQYAGTPSTSDAAGITGLSAQRLCPPAVLDLLGAGFGATQPAGTDVYLPTGAGSCRPAQVLAWSDTRVSVAVPAGLTAGCVGFVRAGKGGSGTPTGVTGELVQCIGAAAENWARGFDKVLGPIASCPPCLPGGANRIEAAGPPIVHRFAFDPPRLEPGQATTLSWNVEAADTIAITHLSGTGPAVPPLPNPVPRLGSVTFPGVAVSSRLQATYRLTARNTCGQVTADTVLTISRTPSFEVTRLEVVQAIQKPDNSVRLTARRSTAVRVFLTSTVGAFDYGNGPGRIGGIDISLYAENLDTGALRDCGPPWNTSVVAGPAPNRDLLADSATLDVPLADCAGNVRFRAVALLPGPPGDPPLAWAEGGTDVTFTDRPAQEILPFLVTDPSSAFPAPTLASVAANLAGATARQPFPAAGFTVNPPLSITLGPGDDLTTIEKWNTLLIETSVLVFLFPSTPVGGIRVVTVPGDPAYALNGLALPRVVVTVPSLIVRAGRPDSCAHELAHVYGLDHVNCGNPAGPYDPRLPATISDPGLDVPGRSLHAAGTSELLGYCRPRWTSIEQWDIIFDRIPV